MIWLDYENLKNAYHKTQRELNDALSELAEFAGKRGAAKQKAEERVEELKKILIEREALLKQKLEELKKSKDTNDKIYRFRYVERDKVRAIQIKVGYSEPQIYRILKEMQERMNQENTVKP